MKIAILGDIHVGCRNNNRTIQHWQGRFFKEIFWPYIEENGITQIIQTGDYFDDRKNINLQALAWQTKNIVKPAQELDCQVHVIVGNHDIPLRHSLENSSVEQILSDEKNFHVYKEPTKVDFADRQITMMPWICKENFEESQTVLQNGGDIVIGHFEITGFVMHPGAISKEGIAVSDFKDWKTVWSGHYHTQSDKGNIQYVGTPYQMSWSDATTKHGFWIFDTDDSSMSFVPNPYRYFNRFTWEDGCDADTSNLERSYVKVAVKKKTNFESFEKFIDRINFGNPHEVKIIEQFEEWSEDNVKDLLTVASTQELISEYVEDVTTSNNKQAITEVLLSIYDEALQVEDL